MTDGCYEHNDNDMGKVISKSQNILLRMIIFRRNIPKHLKVFLPLSLVSHNMSKGYSFTQNLVIYNSFHVLMYR